MTVTHHFYTEDSSIRTLKQQELHRKCLLKIEHQRQQPSPSGTAKVSA